MLDGSIANPWSLSRAVGWAQVLPGQTVYLRGGTYTGNFTVTRPGAIFKPYPGEIVKIDGSFTVNAAGCTFEGMELYSSAWATRQSAFDGSAPADITVLEGFTLNQPNTTIRRCTIHDCRQGIISKADGTTVQDCHFYNNGWLGATDRGHGHGLYAQANVTTPLLIERCVFGPSYSDWGIHAYSADGQTESHITARNNVHIGKIALFYSQAGISDDITITGCETWRGMLEVGQSGSDHHNITIEDNYLIGAGAWYPMTVRRLKDCSVARNTFIATDGQLLSYMTPNTDPPISQVWGQNSYHGAGVQDEAFARTYDAWRTLHGVDSDSTQDTLTPTANRIRVINNRIVVVYNWQGLASVAAPLAGTYINCQNPAESITLAQGAALPMSGWTVATPIAGAGPLAASTFPTFGCFLVTP